MPENAEGSRGLVLGVGCEDLFLIGTLERRELMGVERRVPGVGFQISQRLADGLVPLRLSLVLFQVFQISIRLGRNLRVFTRFTSP